MSNRLSTWTNHAGGYIVCSHIGCSKKIDSSITDHDCCGRCSAGRDCHLRSQESYGGPGAFFHDYDEHLLRPGTCATCGEGRDAH